MADKTIKELEAEFEQSAGLANDSDVAPGQGVPGVPGPATNKVSPLWSALQGVADVGTLGFADEIGALSRKLQTNEPYSSALREVRQERDRNQSANKLAYWMSALPSAAAMSPLGVPGAAAAGAGFSEGGLEDRATSAALSALLGGALGKATRGIGKGFSSLFGRRAAPSAVTGVGNEFGEIMTFAGEGSVAPSRAAQGMAWMTNKAGEAAVAPVVGPAGRQLLRGVSASTRGPVYHAVKEGIQRTADTLGNVSRASKPVFSGATTQGVVRQDVGSIIPNIGDSELVQAAAEMAQRTIEGKRRESGDIAAASEENKQLQTNPEYLRARLKEDKYQ
ncbi:MAG: hypothetical protein MN733_32515 [Nitrososphaera sp.]|nr:hypothetical protein [Nitrososphaera sp.]